LGVIEHPEQKAAPLLIAPAVPQRKLNLKVLLAATVGGLIIVVIFLVSYQRIRPILQASQAPPTSAAQASQDSRVSQLHREAQPSFQPKPRSHTKNRVPPSSRMTTHLPQPNN